MATRKTLGPCDLVAEALAEASNSDVLEIVLCTLEEMAQRMRNAADLVCEGAVPLEAIAEANAFTGRAYELMPSGFEQSERHEEAWMLAYGARNDVADALASWTEPCSPEVSVDA